MNRFRFLSFVLATLCALTAWAPAAFAEEASPHAPWDKRCKSYETPRQFVVESTMYCLRNQPIRECHQKASTYFKGCRFTGDYKKMSQKAQARMLVVLALAGSATLRRGESM
jgi:hypothetical protein